MNKIKILSAVLIIVLIANMILMALKMVNQLTFWGIIIIIAIIAYKFIPLICQK